MPRLLSGLLLAGSALSGWHGQAGWLVLPPLAALALLLAENRAVRRAIGSAAWASEGYARFLVGTNLSILLRSAILNGAILAIATGLHSVLGG